MVDQRRLYWVFTGLLAALMVGSASRQMLDHAWAVESFARLGFPAWLIYPLSAAKLLGVAAVVTGVSPFLKNLAYAGFFYHLSLALGAHIAVEEDLGPACERQIRRHHEAAALVALADEAEQQVGADLVERHISQFVD